MIFFLIALNAMLSKKCYKMCQINVSNVTVMCLITFQLEKKLASNEFSIRIRLFFFNFSPFVVNVFQIVEKIIC